jgi:hypothetical protein
MAFYGLFPKNTNKQVCYIAKNESDLEKIKQTLIIDFYNVKEITSQQFYGLKKGNLIIDQINSTEENIIWIPNNQTILNQDSLNNYIQPILKRLSMLSTRNDYPFLTEVKNYATKLQEVYNVEAQTYTYPLTSSLEEVLVNKGYPEDSVISTLQLP